MSELPVAVDPGDDVAPPRSNGELVFDEPWQGRAFGLCVAVLERNRLGWDDFRPYLVSAIADVPDDPYYNRFVVALEAFVADLV